MKHVIILIIPLFLSGCSPFFSRDAIKEAMNDIMPIDMAQISQEKMAQQLFLKDSSSEKAAFLMSFQKMGFDFFEVVKLMEPGDETYSVIVNGNEVTNMRYFILKNQQRLLMSGKLDEILCNKSMSSVRSDILDKIIEHLELNYKFYMGLKGVE